MFHWTATNRAQADGGGQNVPGDNTAFVVGEWTHNLVVKSGTTLTYYRDGNEVATSSITSAPTNAQPLYLGGQDAREVFSGKFDEVAIFDRALSPEEVTEVHNRGLNGQSLTSGESPSGGLPPLADVGLEAGGGLGLTLPDGLTADIEYSTDLGVWEVIATDVTGRFEETDPTRIGAPEGYYRARE